MTRKPKIYIDGMIGIAGEKILARLSRRDDIELLTIDEAKRKDAQERRKFLNDADLAFLCLPDAASVQAMDLLENPDTKIIDVSSAYRTAPGWVYGLPELTAGHREKIAASSRVANPGCYASGVITLLHPLVELGILPRDSHVVIHALSGYTGGGRKAIAQYNAPDRDKELDSPRQYALGLEHKQVPEMVLMSGLERRIIFNPFICPFPQGMAVSLPLFTDQLSGGQSVEQVRQAYQDFYAREPLIRVREAGLPEDGFLGANNMAGKSGMELFVSGSREQLLIVNRFDNLGKGVSGAAVQNMNLMLGFEELKGVEL